MEVGDVVISKGSRVELAVSETSAIFKAVAEARSEDYFPDLL